MWVWFHQVNASIAFALDYLFDVYVTEYGAKNVVANAKKLAEQSTHTSSVAEIS